MRLKAWSYSRLSVFEQCALKAKLQFIDKVKVPDNVAQARGTAAHLAAYKYVKGESALLPESLVLFGEFLSGLRDAYRAMPTTMLLEPEWAFTKTWELCGWFDMGRCYTRIKPDICYHEDERVLVVVDYKTGAAYKSHAEQLELYAIGAFILHAHIEEVVCIAAYFDSGQSVSVTYFRHQLADLIAKWDLRANHLLTEEKWEPTTGKHCGRCPFKGAQCKS